MKTRILTPIFVAFVMVLASTAIAQPASELLEKAIFTEETVGDLDAAIGIYKQVLDNAEVNRKLAARAQYRLAQCYMKKGQDTEATEAFEKLIANYPDQKELVAQARQQMPGRLVVGPVPWQDGEVMRMMMKLPTGMEIGTFAWTADRVTTDDGVEAWRLQTHRYIALNGTQVISVVDADPETFRPLTSRFDHPLLGETNAVYTPTEVQISGTGRDENTDNTVGFDEIRYDNEQAVYLIRRLPLEVGYKTTLPIFVTFTGKRLDVPLEVLKKQTVKVPAGEFECFKVDLVIENVMHQTMWFSADANRYLVKLNAEGIIGELASVTKNVAGEPVEYHDQRLGFTLSVPAGWYVYEFGEDKAGATKIYLIDPDGAAICVLNAGALELTQIDVTKPVREYAQDRVSRSQLRLKGYTVRPDSWVERSINGRSAVSYVADYMERGQAMTEYRTYVLGEATLSRLRVFCEADRLDEVKPTIDQILSTFKAK
jgi:Protein of unknown function (DUF3108)/Tetratricopeptide repeat